MRPRRTLNSDQARERANRDGDRRDARRILLEGRQGAHREFRRLCRRRFRHACGDSRFQAGVAGQRSEESAARRGGDHPRPDFAPDGDGPAARRLQSLGPAAHRRGVQLQLRRRAESCASGPIPRSPRTPTSRSTPGPRKAASSRSAGSTPTAPSSPTRPASRSIEAWTRRGRRSASPIRECCRPASRFP